jgi:hypothetical protein
VADQIAVLGGAGQHLAGGDRRVELGGERGVALVVVGVERLLDPDQVVLLEDAAHALRGRPVPLLVGVDHDRHRVAEVLRTASTRRMSSALSGWPTLSLMPPMPRSIDAEALTSSCSSGVCRKPPEVL